MSNEVDWNDQTANKKHWDQRTHADDEFFNECHWTYNYSEDEKLKSAPTLSSYFKMRLYIRH